MLGSAAAVPTSERSCSSQLVYCNNRYVLIDCGEGTQQQLRKFNAPIQRINHILISHLHGDHFYGLPGLLGTMSLLGRTSGIQLYGPSALLEILTVIFRASETTLSFNFTFIPLDMNTKEVIFEDDGMRISAFPLKHRIKTFGFSIEEKFQRLKINKNTVMGSNLSNEHLKLLAQGKDFQRLDGSWVMHKDYTIPPSQTRTYSYCSDTKPFPALSDYTQGTTTLFHEATFLSDKKERAKLTFHSTAEEAASLAKVISARKLLLGHFSSRYPDTDQHIEEAKVHFEQVEAVKDGNVYPIE
ncbi:MAG: ribonuclease Z [Flavobacteriales bacterium]